MELVILAIWLLSAWWAATLAYNKGRSRALGLALGLFLSLVGVVIVALIPADRRAVFEREEQWREERAAWRRELASPGHRAPAPRAAFSQRQTAELLVGLGAGAVGLILLAARFL